MKTKNLIAMNTMSNCSGHEYPNKKKDVAKKGLKKARGTVHSFYNKSSLFGCFYVETLGKFQGLPRRVPFHCRRWIPMEFSFSFHFHSNLTFRFHSIPIPSRHNWDPSHSIPSCSQHCVISDHPWQICSCYISSVIVGRTADRVTAV